MCCHVQISSDGAGDAADNASATASCSVSGSVRTTPPRPGVAASFMAPTQRRSRGGAAFFVDLQDAGAPTGSDGAQCPPGALRSTPRPAAGAERSAFKDSPASAAQSSASKRSATMRSSSHAFDPRGHRVSSFAGGGQAFFVDLKQPRSARERVQQLRQAHLRSINAERTPQRGSRGNDGADAVPAERQASPPKWSPERQQRLSHLSLHMPGQRAAQHVGAEPSNAREQQQDHRRAPQRQHAAHSRYEQHQQRSPSAAQRSPRMKHRDGSPFPDVPAAEPPSRQRSQPQSRSPAPPQLPATTAVAAIVPRLQQTLRSLQAELGTHSPHNKDQVLRAASASAGAEQQHQQLLDQPPEKPERSGTSLEAPSTSEVSDASHTSADDLQRLMAKLRHQLAAVRSDPALTPPGATDNDGGRAGRPTARPSTATTPADAATDSGTAARVHAHSAHATGSGTAGAQRTSSAIADSAEMPGLQVTDRSGQRDSSAEAEAAGQARQSPTLRHASSIEQDPHVHAHDNAAAGSVRHFVAAAAAADSVCDGTSSSALSLPGVPVRMARPSGRQAAQQATSTSHAEALQPQPSTRCAP